MTDLFTERRHARLRDRLYRSCPRSRVGRLTRDHRRVRSPRGSTVGRHGFAPPDPTRDLGNHASASLLRDATRLGLRSGARPFRALGHIAVDPRPYQIVPLLMALRLDPVRLLLADDVGVGKTVEALLIARELMDRGEVRRLSVLCPPHLAIQGATP